MEDIGVWPLLVHFMPMGSGITEVFVRKRSKKSPFTIYSDADNHASE